MLRQRLAARYDAFIGTPKSSSSTQHNLNVDKPIVNEWKWGLIGLVVSLVVIAGKLYYANHDNIKQLVLEQRLISYEVITENGDVMFKHAWKTAVKFSNIWLPILCGGLTTYFTWMVVYLDSRMPGVQPPSPFSPSKYKTQSGHSFHLNYVFAVLLGILVSLYMFWRGVDIQY